MEDIKIPSPSAILDPPPPPSTRQTHPPKPAPKAITNKPKQSKSRNGCITCKAKRLKCDETKPTCVQCKKRNVECGGYRKDFKWRPFEESNIVGKPSSSSSSSSKSKKVSASPTRAAQNTQLPTPPATGSQAAPPPGKPAGPRSDDFPLDFNDLLRLHGPSTVGGIEGQSSGFPVTQKDLFRPDKLPVLCPTPLTLDDDTIASSLNDVPPLDDSPWLSLSPEDLATVSEPTPLTAPEDDFSFSALLEDETEEVEDVVRYQPNASSAHDKLATTTSSSCLPRGPQLDPGSPELLVVQFNRFTCGILSIKDGLRENPWRTLIWPMAKTTPALYHAVFSLAAFHCSKSRPALRVAGVDHMRQSITHMVQDIQNMRADAALATSLALAFADTWDQNTRTCIQHLRGAKALVAQVVRFGVQAGSLGGGEGEELERVRFLYHTWVYMDVIARLTAREDCGHQEVDFSLMQVPRATVHQIDPLMGCATTLFPLIDRVARLIQRVRRTATNSISLVSQAIELKRLVEHWEPPDCFEPPRDPTSEVQHSIQTAHAYRWATLLYLHQAVPEMPSEPAPDLAKRVLILLATVPPRSRTTIIQMFPLLAAGCEATQDEDRQWVLGRWAAIQSRLMLGSIDRCIEVVREVWARRDAFETEKQRRQLREMYGPTGDVVPSRRSSAVSGLENIEFEKTVRGPLHWVKVMQEWGWEGMLFHFCGSIALGPN
ncbi:fungal-specific transcription factor domain-containing protein [Aspergillus ambiguus]|uniref:Zn(II)2Cys6 transcription factor n=1 Tax=Aspergillus ambiguus TaxID=176160 RepID=UPI003CCCFFE9